MIPEEVLKKVKKIQITTSRMVTEAFSGHYHSVFRGQGMEFEEVREYQAGDDIRSIDWNVTARTGRPFIKKFREERELTVMLVLDLSRSSFFGSVQKLKRQTAAELCSVLALAAIRNNDRAGLIAFTDRPEIFVPPRKGNSHVLRIIREALYFDPAGRGTDIGLALDYLRRVCRRRTVTFLISDFFDSGYEKILSVTGRRHDIIALSITDPRELELPDVGLAALEDAETGEEFMIDTSSVAVQRDYRARALEMTGERMKVLRSARVDHLDIRTDRPWSAELYRFFRMRERRL